MAVDRQQIADEIAGWQIGSGYYATSVGVTEALEIADALLPLFDRVAADAAADAVQTVADELAGGGYDLGVDGSYPHFDCEDIVAAYLRDRAATLRPSPTPVTAREEQP